MYVYAVGVNKVGNHDNLKSHRCCKPHIHKRRLELKASRRSSTVLTKENKEFLQSIGLILNKKKKNEHLRR